MVFALVISRQSYGFWGTWHIEKSWFLPQTPSISVLFLINFPSILLVHGSWFLVLGSLFLAPKNKQRPPNISIKQSYMILQSCKLRRWNLLCYNSHSLPWGGVKLEASMYDRLRMVNRYNSLTLTKSIISFPSTKVVLFFESTKFLSNFLYILLKSCSRASLLSCADLAGAYCHLVLHVGLAAVGDFACPCGLRP